MLGTWASADRSKWGQLTPPLEKWMKSLKSENMQKEQFSEWGRGEVIRVITA